VSTIVAQRFGCAMSTRKPQEHEEADVPDLGEQLDSSDHRRSMNSGLMLLAVAAVAILAAAVWRWVQG